MTDSDEMLGDLECLHDMIMLTQQIELGAPNTYRRLRRTAQQRQIPVRYHLDTFPARYARVIRRPRSRLYDLEGSEVARVSRLLEHGEDIDGLAGYGENIGFPQYDELDRDLRANAGTSLAEVASSFGALLGQLGSAQPPSATDLPYQLAEFRLIFGHLLTLADAFVYYRSSGLSEAAATARIMERVADRRPGGPGSVVGTAGGVATIRMLLATSRAEDGSELGLAHPAGPADGWLTWYRRILAHAEELVRQRSAALNSAPPMVTPPADAVPPDPPGLGSPRYRYAARFAAAYENAPMTDTSQRPSLESLRFDRAHIAIWLLFSDAYRLFHGHARQLLTDAEHDPGLLEQVLGPGGAGPGRDLREAFTAAISFYTPGNPAHMPPHPSTAPSVREDFEPLHKLPMNRWEVRFRLPELLDLCGRAGPGGGTAGLARATASFIQAREPCRVWLPPAIGELHEIVHLLPIDEDLGHAMTHLGAGSADGYAWRTALLQAADTLTAHIWHHEDNPGR